MSRVACVLPLAALLSGALAAQQVFLDARKAPVTLDMAETKALFAGPLDGDALPDLLVANGYDNLTLAVRFTSRLLLNRGAGRFEEVPYVGAPPFAHYFLAAHDFDGDGILDVLSEGGVAINDGTGRLTFYPAPGFGGGRAVVGDLDADGRADVFSGRALHLGGPSWTFTDVTATRLPPLALGPTPALAIADVDGDGDLDLLAGVRGAQNRLLLNDGGARFSDVTATHLPPDAHETLAVLCRDLDGDGDPDLVWANYGTRSEFYRNDGTGRFALAYGLPSSALPAVSVAGGDLDGDGDVDLALGLESGGKLLLNDGNARFRDAPYGQWQPGPQPSSALVAVDVDADGDLDLVQGSSRVPDDPSPNAGSYGLENTVFFNDGLGVLRPSPAPVLPGTFTGGFVEGSDLDGDGDLDLLQADDGGVLWRGDGWGSFERVELRWPVDGKPQLGDLDGDGDLDGVLVQTNGGFHVLDNPGDGHLWPVRSYWLPSMPPDQWVETGALGDLDGDGDLDLFLATYGRDPRSGLPWAVADAVWHNDGTGRFTDRSDVLPTYPRTASTDAVLGDVDGDGDLDVVTDGGLLYRNQAGRFAAEGMSIVGNWGESHLALADVDGDGAVDIVAGNSCRSMGCAPSGNGGPCAIQWNDGTGRFVTGQFLPLSQATHTTATVAGDFDGDGDVDVAFGNVGTHNTPTNLLYLNDGGRSLRLAGPGEFPLDWDDTVDLVLGDTDGDGDDDLVVINRPLDPGASPRAKVHANAWRHLHAPDHARLGQPYRLDVHGATHGATVFAALAPARIPAGSFGVLGLDPATTVVLAHVAAPTTGRVVQHELTWPNAAVLAGLDVYQQALVYRPAWRDVRLTNRLVERLLAH